MYLRKKKILLGIIAWAALLSLSGCMKSAEHYRKVETGAVRYYKKKYGEKVFTFQVPLEKTADIRVTSGECGDEAQFRHADRPNPAYNLKDSGDKGANWTK